MRDVRDMQPVLDAAEETTGAPDFSLTDTTGRGLRLSDYRRRKHVVLVFNRGFS
jgi:peroxiredoxin